MTELTLKHGLAVLKIALILATAVGQTRPEFSRTPNWVAAARGVSVASKRTGKSRGQRSHYLNAITAKSLHFSSSLGH
ncbi:hypothetical protein ABFT80_27030 [Mesorhizobium sp. SB112]|uniref:hypothetical protein n=1 Tax=Mesorhizobium sp. SB112 TaxID=3151853 RepID=UPI003267A63E